jgi:hypothetical protein
VTVADDALRSVFAFLGFEYDAQKLDQANKSVDSLVLGLEGALAAVSGGLFVSRLNAIADELDTFDDLSAATNVATKDLQAMGLAFELNGSSAEAMQAALYKLNAQLGGLEDGAKTQTEVFKKLGIEVDSTSKKAPTLGAVLPQIFEGFSQLETEADKARVATQLFGRSGTRLIPVLDQGADGLEKMRAELDKLGGGASDDAIAKAGAYRDSLARLHYSFFALKGLIAEQVFPRLTSVTNSLARGVGWLSNWAKQTTLAESASSALALTLGAKLAGALAPYAKAGFKFAGIFLAFDDLMAFLAGKDSLIGTLLNNAFGNGTATAVRAWVNDAGKVWSSFWSKAKEDPQGLVHYLSQPETWAPVIDAMADMGAAGAEAAMSALIDSTLGKITGLQAISRVGGRIARAVEDPGQIVENEWYKPSKLFGALTPQEDPKAVENSLKTWVAVKERQRGGYTPDPTRDRRGMTEVSGEVSGNDVAYHRRALTFGATTPVTLNEPKADPNANTGAMGAVGALLASYAPAANVQAPAPVLVTVQAPVTVTVAPGTDLAQARDVGRAASEGAVGGWQAARDALVQRSAVKK